MTTKRAAKKRSRKAPAKKKAAKTTRNAKKTAGRKAVAKGVQPEVTQEQPPSRERELVLAWFRMLARCRGAWLQHLWLSDGSIDGRATVTHAELAGILADQDSPEAEAE